VDVGEATMQLASASAAGVVNSNSPFFIVSKYGTKQIMLKQHTFNRHICRDDVTYWRCSQVSGLPRDRIPYFMDSFFIRCDRNLAIGLGVRLF